MATNECMLPEFNLFQSKPIQHQVEKTYYQEFTPISIIGDKQPITIVAHGAPHQCWALHKSYLTVSCKITTADGGNVADAVNVTVCNNVLDSLFQQIDVELGDKQIAENNILYPYRSYIENTLCYSEEAQKTWMRGCCYIKDTAGQFAVYSRANDSTNVGAKERGVMFNASTEVQLSGRPHCDLFNQDRVILPNSKLTLKLIPSRDNFVLMTPAPGQNAAQVNYKIKICECRLNICVMQISDSLNLALEKMLLTTNANYPITRVTMKHLSIPIGSTNVLQDNLFLGKIPKRVVLGIVTDASMGGGYQQNPFNFAPNGLNYLVLNVNGDMVPNKPLTPDYANHKYLSVYNMLFEGMRNQYSNTPVNITYSEFENGYAFYVFDLTAHGHSGCMSSLQNGTVRIEAKFAAATTAVLNIICFAEYDDHFEVDKFGQTIALNY